MGSETSEIWGILIHRFGRVATTELGSRRVAARYLIRLFRRITLPSEGTRVDARGCRSRIFTQRTPWLATPSLPVLLLPLRLFVASSCVPVLKRNSLRWLHSFVASA